MRSLHALALILGVAELGAACANDGSAPSHTPTTADFMSSCAGLACSFTDRSSGGDGQLAAYKWDFGDGTPAATTKDTHHTYAAGSSYSVKLTVTENDGTSSEVTKLVQVRSPANVPPTANFTTSCADLACSFTDLSRDGDGTVVGFHWDLGDGVVLETRNSRHAYASAGTYVVELTVADNSGATASASQQVTVAGPLRGAMIGISPTSLKFSTRRIYGDPPSERLSLTNIGTGMLNWEAKASSYHSWLSVSPASGTAPSDISVSVNTAGLGSLGGVYFGRITVSAVGASNSPQTVLVTLYRR
jgi:PKD repeat protein